MEPIFLNGLEALSKLEAAWELETGFLGCLREGVFDAVYYVDFITLLMRIRVHEHDVLPRRFVSLLWFVPLFMEWQTERVMPTISLSDYQYARTSVENQLERILGLP